MRLDRPDITIDQALTQGLIVAQATANPSATVEINDPTIAITAGSAGTLIGSTVSIIGGTMTYNSPSSFFQQQVLANGTLNITGMGFSGVAGFNNTYPIFVANNASATLSVTQSRFTGGDSNLIYVGVIAGTANIFNNLFYEFGSAAKAAYSLGGTLNLVNNTFVNAIRAGVGVYKQAGTAVVANNIFSGVSSPCQGNNCGAAGYATSYNDYFDTTDVVNPGTGSITDNPIMTSDYKLSTLSPAKNAGTGAITRAQWVSIGGDMASKYPTGTAASIGAYQYQQRRFVTFNGHTRVFTNRALATNVNAYAQ